MRNQIVNIICNADPLVFSENDSDVPKELMKIIADSNGIPCGGEQIVGVGCIGCPFGDYDYLYEV